VFLLALVLVLHGVGVMLLLRMAAPAVAAEMPTVLQVSWIADGLPAPAAPTVAQETLAPVPARRRAARTPAVRTPVARSHSRVGPARISSPVESAPEQTAAPVAASAGTDLPVAAAEDAGGAGRLDLSVTAPAIAAVGNGREGGGADYVGPDFNANYLANPEPEYPPLSRRLREQGLVQLRIYVTVEGRCGEVELFRSSGYERLDRAATDGVRRWRFRPAQRAGMAVAGWVVVPIRFHFQG
jgi:protein TonB